MCDTGLFHAFNRQRGKEEPRKEQTQTGAGTKISHPEPKRRVNLPMVPPGGFLRGEQFERERVVPPLSRLLCILSCRSKKVWPRWQALAESRLNNRQKGSNRVTMTSGKYHPIRKPSACRPQAPSVTCGDSSLPEGAMGFCLFTWACAYGKVPTVNPSVTAAPCQLPFAREPLGGVSLACRRFLKYLPPLGSYGRFFRGYMGKFRKSVWVLAE